MLARPVDHSLRIGLTSPNDLLTAPVTHHWRLPPAFQRTTTGVASVTFSRTSGRQVVPFVLWTKWIGYQS